MTIDELIEDLKSDPWLDDDPDNDLEVLGTEFQDGGRWSNIETTAFRLGTKYFEMEREVPATEMQDGGDFSVEIYEVQPYEVTVTKYKRVGKQLHEWRWSY